VVDVVGLGPLLVLERRRALHPAHGGHGRQQPHQLDVLGSVRLAEQDGLLGIQTERQQPERHLVRVAADGLAVVGRRERVIVHDAVDRIVGLLHRDVVPERPEVVADMRQAGGLDTAEHPFSGEGIAAEGRRAEGSGLGGHGGRV
jgi:hypothetical protein